MHFLITGRSLIQRQALGVATNRKGRHQPRIVCQAVRETSGRASADGLKFAVVRFITSVLVTGIVGGPLDLAGVINAFPCPWHCKTGLIKSKVTSFLQFSKLDLLLARGQEAALGHQ